MNQPPRAPHITIVTFAWPPRNSIAAHRPYSWARYWSEAGARVRVLTARKYAYDAPLDLDLPVLPEVEVIETAYGARGSSLFRLLSSHLQRGLVRRMLLKLRGQSLVRIANPREAWLAAVRPMLARWAQETDYVVSTYDPRMVHQIAAEMKAANPDLKWIADYRDLWSLNHMASRSASQKGTEEAMERATVGRYADMVTSVSEDLARQQGTCLDKPWLTVTNGFDMDIAAVRKAVEAGPSRAGVPLMIVYTGKIYPKLRDPLPLFEAIAALEGEGRIEKGVVQVHIYGGQTEGLEHVVGAGRFDHMLHMHGHVSREAALAAQSRADLLLLLESPLPEARGVLTGKIFEYMATGVPILSLGSRRDSAIGEVLGRTATGLCTEDDQEAIRSALLGRMAGETPGWFKPDMAEIETYSRKSQAMAMFAAMIR